MRIHRRADDAQAPQYRCLANQLHHLLCDASDNGAVPVDAGNTHPTQQCLFVEAGTVLNDLSAPVDEAIPHARQMDVHRRGPEAIETEPDILHRNVLASASGPWPFEQPSFRLNTDSNLVSLVKVAGYHAAAPDGVQTGAKGREEGRQDKNCNRQQERPQHDAGCRPRRPPHAADDDPNFAQVRPTLGTRQRRYASYTIAAPAARRQVGGSSRPRRAQPPQEQDKDANDAYQHAGRPDQPAWRASRHECQRWRDRHGDCRC